MEKVEHQDRFAWETVRGCDVRMIGQARAGDGRVKSITKGEWTDRGRSRNEQVSHGCEVDVAGSDSVAKLSQSAEPAGAARDVEHRAWFSQNLMQTALFGIPARIRLEAEIRRLRFAKRHPNVFNVSLDLFEPPQERDLRAGFAFVGKDRAQWPQRLPHRPAFSFRDATE